MTKMTLRNEYRNSLLMACYYLDLSSNCDWMKQILLAVQQIKTGAHNPERSTAINSCNGVFTSEFIFR